MSLIENIKNTNELILNYAIVFQFSKELTRVFQTTKSSVTNKFTMKGCEYTTPSIQSIMFSHSPWLRFLGPYSRPDVVWEKFWILIWALLKQTRLRSTPIAEPWIFTFKYILWPIICQTTAYFWYISCTVTIFQQKCTFFTNRPSLGNGSLCLFKTRPWLSAVNKMVNIHLL